MAFPAGVCLVTIYGGPFLEVDATIASGWVEFLLLEPLHVVSDPTIIIPSRYVAELDSTGSFVIQLPATDATDLIPVPFFYQVNEELTTNNLAPFYIQLPCAMPIVNYASLSPLPVMPPPSFVGYATLADLAAAQALDVHIVGTETITGDKTFATTPQITNAPINPADAANKAYVDSVSGSADFTWTQSTPASTWVITHGLNSHPIVQYLDFSLLGGEADIVYTSLNTLNLVFPSPTTGTATMRR